MTDKLKTWPLTAAALALCFVLLFMVYSLGEQLKAAETRNNNQYATIVEMQGGPQYLEV